MKMLPLTIKGLSYKEYHRLWRLAHPLQMKEYYRRANAKPRRKAKQRSWQAQRMSSRTAQPSLRNPVLWHGAHISKPGGKDKLTGWREDEAQDRELAKLERLALESGK